jgi:hypothetical protein
LDFFNEVFLPFMVPAPGAARSAAGPAIRGEGIARAEGALEAAPSGAVGEIAGQINRPGQEVAGLVEEVARRRSLGTSSNGYNAVEEAAALELERKLGKKLTRDPSNAADWLVGKTSYDHWTTNPAFFEQQLNNGNLLKSLKRHVDGVKADYAVVDTLGLNEAQLAKLKELINGLSPAERARIIDLRGNLGLK